MVKSPEKSASPLLSTSPSEITKLPPSSTVILAVVNLYDPLLLVSIPPL